MRLEHTRRFASISDDALYQRLRAYLLSLGQRYPDVPVEVRWHPEARAADFVWERVDIRMEVQGEVLRIAADLPLRYLPLKPIIVRYLETFLNDV